MKTLIVGTCLTLAAHVFAAGSSTEAFYAFRDAAPGTAVTSGLTLTNSLGGSSYQGSLTAGNVTFSADVPGPYVLDGIDGQTVVKDPQSLDFAASGGISLADIVDTLAKTNQFTVEFFFRKPSTAASKYSTLMTFRIGGADNDLAKVFAPFDPLTRVGMSISGSVSGSRYIDNITINDGQWHHAAVRFKNNSLYFLLDYKLAGKNNGTEAFPASSFASAGGGIALGGSANFSGQIACVRVSQKFLEPDQLLRASNSPIYDPGDAGLPIPATTPTARLNSDKGWWMARHTEKLTEIAERGSEIKTAFVGDSLTHLWDQAIWNQSFDCYHPINLGYTSDRTEHVLWRIENGELDGYSADRVVLLIGTNNRSSSDREIEPVAHTVRGIKAVIDAIKAKQPTAKIYLHAIFPRGDFDSEGLRKLCLVNDAIKDYADGTSVIWCDFYNRFLNTDGSLNESLFKADKLHLTTAGYEVWRDGLVAKFEELHLGDLREGTVAFYAFNDAEIGVSLDGHQLLNAVDGTKYVGTPTLKDESETVDAVCQCSAERPGKYVFDGAGYKRTPFLVNPRSLYVWGETPNLSATVKSGAKVSFAGLASKISSCSEYTVEFFYKIPSTAKAYNWFSESFSWETASGRRGVQLPYHTGSGVTMNKVMLKSPSAAKTVTFPARISDDRWHHVAIVRQGGSTRLFCDYAKMSEAVADASVEPDDGVYPLVLANDYRYFGYVSCLRVVTKALAPGEMLFASDDEKCISAETVAYWAYDGSKGSALNPVESTVTNKTPFAGQYFAETLDGAGQIKVAASAGVVTNTMAFERKMIFAGGKRIKGDNTGAAALGWVAGGSGVFNLPVSQHVPVHAGSFTFETFYRFDKAAWEAHKTGSTYCAMAAKPSSGESRTYDWWGGLWVYGSGSLVLSAATKDPSNPVVKQAAACPEAIDGRWHHFAVVYDESSLTMKIYLDYKEKVAAVLPAALSRAVDPANDMLTVGYGGEANTPFVGLLDETRYSRIALSPAQFLRAKNGLGLYVAVY